MSRATLPHRRPNTTRTLELNGHRIHLTIGFDPLDRPREMFARLEKPGSDLDLLLDDIGVLVSVALQHGATPADLAHSMGRLSTGERASILGHLIDALAAEVAA
jgi:ribonucleoside-diphosphate reductase alpha chain